MWPVHGRIHVGDAGGCVQEFQGLQTEIAPSALVPLAIWLTIGARWRKVTRVFKVEYLLRGQLRE
jgi:hypothetical protein